MDWTTGLEFLSGVGIYLLLHRFQNDSGVHPAYQMDTGVIFHGVKAARV
jgi:hypothetical protein